MVIMWSVFPTFVNRVFYSNELTAFAMYYMLGAYIRIYPDSFFAKKSRCAVLAAGSLAAAMLWSAAVIFGGNTVPSLICEVNWYSRNSLFMILTALSLLALFSQLNINSRLINAVGGCTFGVYLIHENEYVRSFLWHTLFKVESFKDSPWMILHMAACAAAVFAVCSVVEYVRKMLVEKYVMNIYSMAETYFVNSRFCRKINAYIERKIG